MFLTGFSHLTRRSKTFFSNTPKPPSKTAVLAGVKENRKYPPLGVDYNSLLYYYLERRDWFLTYGGRAKTGG